MTFVEGGECTVTETQTGGAASVVYECEGTIPPPDLVDGASGGGRFSPRLTGVQRTTPCETSGPQSDPMTVFIEAENQEATVTVTNTFEPTAAAVPAEPVEGAPRFTG